MREWLARTYNAGKTEPKLPPYLGEALMSDGTTVKVTLVKSLAGQPLDLFESASRLPVVLELLSTPWIRRGSQIDGPRRVEVEVPVVHHLAVHLLEPLAVAARRSNAAGEGGVRSASNARFPARGGPAAIAGNL